jgi:hypothetical protein
MRHAHLAAVLALGLFACSSDSEGNAPNNGPSSGFDAAQSPATTGDAGSGMTGSTAGGGTAAGGSSTADAGGTTPVREAGATPMPDAGSLMPASDAGAASDAASSGDGGTTGAGGCTRESLAAAVDLYYTALAAKQPAMLNASPMVKFTQDGKTLKLGEGLWMTAGTVKFKGRSALDTTQCETATESVVQNGSDDYIVGLRLKLTGGQISEVETILVGPDGWFPNPAAIISSASDDWEKPLLAEGERSTRDKLQKDIVDAYFIGLFGGTIKVADYPFASECKRAENGFSPGACNFGIPTSMRMMPLHYVLDVEAGIAVGFVLFGGSSRSGLDDFHMFKVKSGKVYGVHAVVGPTVSSRGW